MLGERGWAALYQQRPRLREGGVFAIDRIPVLDAAEAEAPLRTVRAWDLAATSGGTGDPDWTVGIRATRTANARYVIEDVVRLRGGPGAVESAIRATAERDGKSTAIGLPQDPGQAGRAQLAYLTRQLAGFRVHGSPESGVQGNPRDAGGRARPKPATSRCSAPPGTACCWKSSATSRTAPRTTRWTRSRGRSPCWRKRRGCRSGG